MLFAATNAAAQATPPAIVCDSMARSEDFDLLGLRPVGEESKRNWTEACYHQGQITLRVRNGRIEYLLQPLASYTLTTRTDTTTLRRLKHLYDTIIITPTTIFFQHKLFSPAGRNLLTEYYWLKIDTSTHQASLQTAQLKGDYGLMDFLAQVLEGKEGGFKDWKKEKTVLLRKTKDGYYFGNESLFDLLLSNFFLLLN